MTQRPLPNSYWVLPGSLLAGEHPAGRHESQLPARLNRLLTAGIDCFFDLTEPGEWPDYYALLPGHVEYRRSAIVDCTVPRGTAQMRTILADIRHALEGGRRIYLHCRAGIGRTGTVVGCYLAEQGLDGPAALAQLNELWRQSARSSTWPQVPQTREQEQYILRWRRHDKRAPAPGAFAGPNDPPARARAALLGLAAAAAQAAALHDREHTIALALAPAESLLAAGAFEAAPQGMRSDAAMLLRMAPAVLYFHAPAVAAIERAVDAARIVGASPLLLDCCRLLAAMLHAALGGASKSQVLAPSAFGSHPLQRRVMALARSQPVEPAPLKIDADAMRLLAAARWAVASGADFRDGALRARRLGGDGVVLAAVYGQLAGAHYGPAAIPTEWLGSSKERAHVETLADRLFQTGTTDRHGR
jgi:hypothetical protein